MCDLLFQLINILSFAATLSPSYSGLDKAYKKNGKVVDYELQKAVFAEQLGLAASLRRPVSVHCVRAYGHLMETLQRVPELPPTIALQYASGAFAVKWGPPDLFATIVAVGAILLLPCHTAHLQARLKSHRHCYGERILMWSFACIELRR